MARKHGTRHHRKPTSRGGSNKGDNVSYVTRHSHEHYHALFKNMQPPEIAKLLTGVWIDPDYYLVAVPRNKQRKPNRRHVLICAECGSTHIIKKEVLVEKE